MKKTVVRIVALLMVTISVLALPLAVGATSYSGGVGTINYIMYTGENSSHIKSSISTSSNTNIKIKIRTFVDVEGMDSPYTYRKTVSANNTNYFLYSYYFTQFVLDHPLYNVQSMFRECYYSGYENGSWFLLDANEQF